MSVTPQSAPALAFSPEVIIRGPSATAGAPAGAVTLGGPAIGGTAIGAGPATGSTAMGSGAGSSTMGAGPSGNNTAVLPAKADRN
ncbi:hypothetical protein [Ramlibacter montanisoli]|uniref:hypothetical protein n=1 Tax=Ramlibacter montanisoli TaxID=2732512 RepID=UPI001C0F037E|nr:hypothetical protein [Ramlibacter montanisoli]